MQPVDDARSFHRDNSELGPGANISGQAVNDSELSRADDSKLRDEMGWILSSIEQHAGNFNDLDKKYDSSEMEYDSPDTDADKSLGVKTLRDRLWDAGFNETSSTDTASLLRCRRTRSLGVRVVIARIMLGNMKWRSSAETSLLPDYAVALIKDIDVARVAGDHKCEFISSITSGLSLT